MLSIILSITLIVLYLVIIFISSYFGTFGIDKKYKENYKNLYYFLNNVFFNKVSYYDIKFHNCFSVAYHNEFICEKNNKFILTDKGLSFLYNNDFIKNTRMNLLSIITIFLSFSNILLQIFGILKMVS